MGYAAKTTVDENRSIAEIRRLVTRYGAQRFGFLETSGMAEIAFETHNRRVRMTLVLPDPLDQKYTRTPLGKPRSKVVAIDAWKQARRERFRVLVLLLKAKFEAIEHGVFGFDSAFYPDLVMPDGRTVQEWTAGWVYQGIEADKTPPVLFLAEPQYVG